MTQERSEPVPLQYKGHNSYPLCPWFNRVDGKPETFVIIFSIYKPIMRQHPSIFLDVLKKPINTLN
jgi:hypothetical protein